jgi:predicted nucleic acid-binding protein
MVKSLLDTDILSEYLKGHNQIVAGHAAQYAEQYRVFSFTSVTVYEIVYGLELKGFRSVEESFGLAQPKRTDYADQRRLRYCGLH